MIARRTAMVIALACVAAAHGTDVARVGNRSPAFRVPDEAVSYYANHTAWVVTNSATGEGLRELTAEIEPKILDMIDHAERYLVLSFFLFDNFYADTSEERDIVSRIVGHILDRKHLRPQLSVAVILDPSNKAYSDRVSPAEAQLRANGVDVFYSDLISGLKKGTFLGVRETLGHTTRLLDVLTLRIGSRLLSGAGAKVPVPFAEFDQHPVSAESIYNVALAKANHRKLVVADRDGGGMEVLVSSANPHNASAFHINNAVAVRGAPAVYTYNVLRQDMIHCARLGSKHAHWHLERGKVNRRRYFDTIFPALPLPATPGHEEDTMTRVTVLTEREIETAVLQLLQGVEAGDEVDIQMFYLSYRDVVDALVEASTRVARPIRLLLDANKDSFNREKDGTPNRQVARHLLRESRKRGGLIEVRWYLTHGEQNHVKTAAIRNSETGKAQLMMGSCNWTGRNLAGVNMEANVLVENSPATVAAFRARFDEAWENRGGKLYSEPYSAWADETADDRKWVLGEKPFYYSTF